MMHGDILPESDHRLARSAHYAPAQPTRPTRGHPVRPGPGAAAGAIDRSARHGEEHVIKFTCHCRGLPARRSSQGNRRRAHRQARQPPCPACP